MSDDILEINETDFERATIESFGHGHIAKLDRLSDELREQAGEEWAEASNHKEIELAKQLKRLAREFECRAKDKRQKWDGKWGEFDLSGGDPDDA